MALRFILPPGVVPLENVDRSNMPVMGEPRRVAPSESTCVDHSAVLKLFEPFSVKLGAVVGTFIFLVMDPPRKLPF